MSVDLWRVTCVGAYTMIIDLGSSQWCKFFGWLRLVLSSRFVFVLVFCLTFERLLADPSYMLGAGWQEKS